MSNIKMDEIKILVALGAVWSVIAYIFCCRCFH